METNFATQCAILSDLWMNYRGDSEFTDFLDYNDIGLPLAYFVASELVTPSPLATQYIIETFELLCVALHLPIEAEYQTLEHMFTLAAQLDN